jgi:sensor domain CHASE-containing protein
MYDDTLFALATQLESYKISYLTETADPEYDFEHHALRLWAVDDWCFWDDVARFVELSKDPIEVFCVEMDFGRLDEE